MRNFTRCVPLLNVYRTISCVRTTNVECTITIFGRGNNVLNYIIPYFAIVSLSVKAKFKLVRTF